jgi:predicted CoA-binding protein
MNHDAYDNAYIAGILNSVKTIAMVGASANWNRPSFFAMKYLQGKGYRVIPVNPAAAGQAILGEKVYSSLSEIPEKIEMVDVFRNSAAAGPITDEAIRLGAKVVWMQIGVINQDAAKRAEAAGLKVVMNRCPKIEWSRLNGELAWSGVNTGIVSSKRAPGAAGWQPGHVGGFSSKRVKRG